MQSEKLIHLCDISYTCGITSTLHLCIILALFKAKQHRQSLTRNELAILINRPRTTTLTALTQLHRSSLISITESNPDIIEISDSGLAICKAADLS